MNNRILFSFYSLFAVVYTQTNLDDNCVLTNGQQGKCLYFKNCPSAIELVKHQNRRPVTCGFEGTQPIICCETKQNFGILKVGEITRQKCKETYTALNFDAPAPRPVFVVVNNPQSSLFSISRPKRQDATIGLVPVDDDQVFVVSAVGGKDAPSEKYRHMAALGYGQAPNITWLCGGSLISDKYILTAAHCIEARGVGRVKYVRLGDLNIKSITDDADPQDFTVTRIISHPSYKAPLAYHDIALLELDRKPTFNRYVLPACLHTQKDITDPVWIATGWGTTSYGGETADHLQEVSLRQFTHAECNTAYETTSKRRLSNGIDDNTQVCAGESLKDTCQGDSGGPLQITNPEYKQGFTLIGVTSFGKACGIGTNPAVYSRVSHYIGWIETIVWPQ